MCTDHISKKRKQLTVSNNNTITTDIVANNLQIDVNVNGIFNNNNNINITNVINNNNSNNNNRGNNIIEISNGFLTEEGEQIDVKGLFDIFFSSLEEIDNYMTMPINNINNNNMNDALETTQDINNNNNNKHSIINENMNTNIYNNNNNNNISQDNEILNMFINIIQSKATSEEDYLIQGLIKSGDSVLKTMKEKYKIIQFNSVQNLENLKTEIEKLVETYSVVFNNVAIPTLIFDRTGVIYYVNQSYKTLTSFNFPLPTGRSQFAFYVSIFFLI